MEKNPSLPQQIQFQLGFCVKDQISLLLKWRLARVMVLSFPPLVPTYSGVLKHTHLASRQEKLPLLQGLKDALDSTLSHISKTLAMGHIPPLPPQASLPFSQQTCSTNSILSNKQTRTLFPQLSLAKTQSLLLSISRKTCLHPGTPFLYLLLILKLI